MCNVIEEATNFDIFRRRIIDGVEICKSYQNHYARKQEETTMALDYQAIGKRIRVLRKQNHMTQAELAEKVGISTSFIGHIELGTRIASL